MISSTTTEAMLWIGGEWQPAADGAVFDVIDPATGNVTACVANAGEADVDKAVAIAQEAFNDQRWLSVPPLERGRILRRIAELIRQHHYELAQLMTRENGMPLNQALFIEIPLAADCFDFFASLVVKPHGDVLPFAVAGGAPDYMAWTVKEPIGVAGLITPWNFPLLMPSWKIAPALAAGCTMVVKPAPETPLTALKLAELCHEAGVPEGVVNVLPGLDEAGKALVRHPGVPKIAFTGETATGRHILQAAAPHIKRVTLELGGKSPNVIFADADLEQAAKSALFGVFYNSGQVCQAGSRILVERTVYEPFVERLAERAKKLKVGPGTNARSDLGPVISQEQYEKVLRYIEIGKQEGARLAAGGRALDGLGGGYFIEPTVFADVSPSMRIACEEIFGPVAAVIPFDDEEEAVRIANGTMYGLAAAVWTNDIKRALRLAQRVKSGTVWINTYQVLSPTAPFGGYKQSGLGRELGMQALDAYLETKTVICDLNDRPMTLF
ncbi:MULTISPECIES: aldehyde dehydrogenase family protein [Geobacillus]|uniref:Aldehyde dehydrogenase n=1 Tax=Geobacillus thermocatenulatus TaxID=33938 RepID=A0A226QBF5_9BACL|nr:MULTISPECIES: aldehyde dehydrogenase family protein [Geobacillus]ASS98550.1 aldehyde dehydrogenase [Geobacillus thermocatenulatus]KLR74064.1 aldehyde dehydrogenase [Geobacillus sp. T6]OXB89304.1 aldehyde dehydrogenase [Geobacillus thermocatenulatus]RAN22452.1 aldehyde dehydrogenase [Geobacillus sp. A8]